MRLRLSHSKLLRSIKPITAFDWAVYLSRADSLRLLWRKRIQVDTQISTRDGLFTELAHWQVLVAFSPELIDASELVESEHSNKLILLPANVSGQLARLLVSCAYGEPIELDKSSLQQLFSISEFYSIQHSITICLSFARRQLDVTNCIQLLLLGIKYKHQKLKRSAYAMLRSNFKLILHSNDDFHLIPFEQFRRLLVDDHLSINEDEELSYVAILSWLSDHRLDGAEIKRLYLELCSSAATRVCNISGATVGSAAASAMIQPIQTRGKSILTSSSATIRRIVHPLSNQQQQLDFLNHYSPPTPFESISRPNCGAKNPPNWQTTISNKDLLVGCCKISVEDKSNNENQESFMAAPREEQIYELFKCLRFMRFRSLNAFNVMLASPEVQSSEKLTSLIRHMRARYVVRKRLDKSQVGEDLPPECLDMLQISEAKQPMRFLMTSLKQFKRLHLFHWTPRTADGDHQVSTSCGQDGLQEQKVEHENNDIKVQQQVKLTRKILLEQLKTDELRRANEPRVPSSVALLIGGWQDGKVCRSLLAYDYICDNWYKLRPILPEPRAFHATCSLPKSGHVYIMGGTNGKLILNSVLRFDPFHGLRLRSQNKYLSDRDGITTTTTGACPSSRPNRNWLKKFIDARQHLGVDGKRELEFKFQIVGQMNERRCHLSAVYNPTDGRLYALGGHNGLQRLRSGEWFDTRCNQWHPIADMTIARSDASACPHAGKIFIAGGQIGDQFIQSSVEFYKPSDNTWTFVSSMIVPRMAFKLASFKSHLLAIGGTNGLLGDEVGSVTRSVERYDHNSGSWSLAAPMKQKRGAFGMIQMGGQLIVVGGHNGRRRLRTCEALRIGHLESPVLTRITRPEVVQQNETQAQQVDGVGHQLQRRIGFGHREVSPVRSVMRWVAKAKLPIKRSGFSIVTVYSLRNAKQFTYHGSKLQNLSRPQQNAMKIGPQRPALIKRRSKWSRLKIVRRRKLVRHLKIALAISIVYMLIM